MNNSSRRHLLALWLAIVFALTTSWSVRAQEKSEPRPVILLVHGLVMKKDAPSQVWGKPRDRRENGTQWTGMIGHLEKLNLNFGGVLCFKVGPFKLPDNLDQHATLGDPRKADFFSMEFSLRSKEGGLEAMTDELAAAIEHLCKFTGRKKVFLVCHSVGGLAARAYVQGVMQNIPYRKDVARIITIGTPHLGSVLAMSFGDLLGTRAEQIRNDSNYIRELNENLDFPPDVKFASIVVRGIREDTNDLGTAYNKLTDRDFLFLLPQDFQKGGDGAVHVRSQNLRLSSCARRYETKTKQAVQYVVARVPGPLTNIHCNALDDVDVKLIVEKFIGSEEGYWTGTWERLTRWSQWLDYQASWYAFDLTEQAYNDLHAVLSVRPNSAYVDFLGQKGGHHLYCFHSEGNWTGWFSEGIDRVNGTFKLITDKYGRLRGHDYRYSEKKWLYKTDVLQDTTGTDFLISANHAKNNGQHSLAIDKYNKALTLLVDKEKFKEASRGLGEVYNFAGVAYFTRANYEWANELFSKAAEYDPVNGVIFANRGNTLSHLGKADKALEEFQKGFRLGYQKAWAYFHRGKLLYGKRDYRGALGDFSEAIWLEPDHTDVGYYYLWRGATYLRQKKYQWAISDFTEALKHLSESLVEDRAYCLEYRGFCSFRLGKYDMARKDFETLLRQNPRSLAAHRGLIVLFAACPDPKHRDCNRALELAQQAMKLSEGRHPWVFASLAIAYASTGDFEKAVHWQEAALKAATTSEDFPVRHEDLDSPKELLKLYQATPIKFPESPPAWYWLSGNNNNTDKDEEAWKRRMSHIIEDDFDIIVTINVKKLREAHLFKRENISDWIDSVIASFGSERDSIKAIGTNDWKAVNRITVAYRSAKNANDSLFVGLLEGRFDPKLAREFLLRKTTLINKDHILPKSKPFLFEGDDVLLAVTPEIVFWGNSKQRVKRGLTLADSLEPEKLTTDFGNAVSGLNLGATLSLVGRRSQFSDGLSEIFTSFAIDIHVSEDIRLQAYATPKDGGAKIQEAQKEIEKWRKESELGEVAKDLLKGIRFSPRFNTLEIRLRVDPVLAGRFFKELPMFKE